MQRHWEMDRKHPGLGWSVLVERLETVSSVEIVLLSTRFQRQGLVTDDGDGI